MPSTLNNWPVFLWASSCSSSSSVPCWVHDAPRGKAPELRPSDAQRAAASSSESAAVHPIGNGARVPILQQLFGRAGLPVAVSFHCHCVQLLLLHVPRPCGQSGNVSTRQTCSAPVQALCSPCWELCMFTAHGSTSLTVGLIFRLRQYQRRCIATPGWTNTSFQHVYDARCH